ncbi:BEACH domain-containing protein [Tribonema minus]|uniref:BEACH domain-containing protein n=1 Tax=Tribonema minus TaxID=303371 RepID=A0A835ZAZ6_9STRA|nr:BEACH domain-containing protein [Tribonema minus]
MSQEKEEWSFTAAGGTGPRKKTRFNLLLLEHGEYYFQDYSVNYLPQARNMLPLPSNTGTLTSKGNVQIRGRLKLCSRGLLFEPADVSLPCVKYPFRSMDMPLTPAGAGRAAALRFGGAGAVKGHGALRYSEEGGLEGVFTMYCSSTMEMKANNRVGPYVYRRRGDTPTADGPATLGVGRATPDGDSGNPFVSPSWLFTFELLHTPLADFLAEAQRLREIALAVRAKGHAHEAALLSGVLSERVEGVLARGFDTFHLVDFREALLMDAPVQVGRITPLLRNPGCLMVTDKRVYFQPAEVNNVGEQMASFELARLKQLFKRRHMLRHTALELLLEDKTSGYFDFRSREERDQVFALIMQQPGVGQRVTRSMDVEAELRRWQRGEIDNYQYLAFLNTAADRSVNDLTQYPVYPWVISDYTSETLDLDDPATYRDLSKPIGALNAQRLEYFKQRLVSMPDPGAPPPRPPPLRAAPHVRMHAAALHEGQGIPPPFLYGTHYSTPGYVLFFLVRTAPEHMLCLQNGRFDAADRMFYSMASTWESVFANHADLKELIPEFYAGSGKFLGNTDDLQLGVTQTGQRLGDVELPPWARSGRDFIARCRAALESAHVSARLHLWIDLIFGCKQRGAAALDADNLFYHLTYEGNVDLDAIDDPRERAALESQARAAAVAARGGSADLP